MYSFQKNKNLFLLTAVVSILILCTSALNAQPVGPNSPSSFSTSNTILAGGGGGTIPWNNTSDASSSNNVYAFLTTTEKNKETYEIVAQGFNFNIPSNAIIDGILVEIERYYTCSGAGTVTDQDITLLDQNGAQTGTIKNPGITWPNSDANTYQSYGGAADIWGTTLSYSQINDPDFGIAFTAKTSNTNSVSWNLYIDHIRVTVYYSIAPPCDRYSVASGNWSSTATWSNTSGGAPGASVPTSTCNVFIENGNTVNIDANSNCNALTLSGSTINYPANNTLSVNGDLSVTGNCSVTGNNAGMILNILGNTTVNSSAGLTLNGETINLSGTATIDGTLTLANSIGSKSFFNIIINNGGTINNSGNSAVNIAGNFQNNGSFTSGTGIYYFNGTNKIISGANLSSFGTANIIGTITNNGLLDIKTLTLSNTFANNGTVTASSLTCNAVYTNNGTTTVNGALFNGSSSFTQGNNSTLNTIITPTVTTLNTTNTGNTVNYTGSGINVKSATYYNLKISNTGAKTLAGDVTINGDLSIDGGSLNSSTFQISGNISGTSKFTMASGTSFTLGLINSTTCPQFPLYFSNSNTTLDPTSTVTYQCNSASDVISNTPTYGNLSITNGNTIITKTLPANLNVNGNFNAASGAKALTVVLGGNTINIGGNLTGTATLTITTGTINIGGSNNSYTGTINIGNSLFNFNGTGAQNVKALTYYNFQTNNSGGSVTLNGNTNVTGYLTINNGSFITGANQFAVTGDLTINGGDLSLANNNFSVTGNSSITGSIVFSSALGIKTFNGNVIINNGGIWNAIAAIPVTINGNLQNDGTFTSNSGAYTFTGTGKTMSGTNSLIFDNVTINTGASYTTTTNTTITTALSGVGSLAVGTDNSLTLGGTCTVTTFIPNNNNATVYFNSALAGQTVPANTYYNLVIDKNVQTATAGGNISVNNDLTITSGGLSIGANNISVTGITNINGTLALTSATGTKTFGDLNIYSSGSLTNSGNANVTVNGNLLTDGIITPGSGTYTFTGTGKTFTGANGFSNMNGNITGTYTYNCSTNSSFGNLTVGNQLTVANDRGLNINTTFINNGTTNVDAGPNGHSGSIITPASITNTGTCTFKTSIAKGKWHGISSPVKDATVNGVFTDLASNNNNCYVYNEAATDNSYWVQTTSGAITPSKGYYIYYFNNKYKTYSSAGAGNGYNAGTVIANVSYSNPGRKGWNFIGNPYPSAIDWDDAINITLTNVNSAIYTKNGDAWEPYTRGLGTADRYIYPGQGFFVVATANGNVTFNNNARVHYNAGSLKSNQSTLNTTIPTLCLELGNDSMKNKSFFRFITEATNNFDGQYDAYKFFSEKNIYPELFSLSTGNDTLSINSMPLISTDTIIPIGIKIGVQGTYTIRAKDILNFEEFSEIYLEDTYNSTWTNLLQDSAYSFTSNVCRETNRFFLHFNRVITETPNSITSSVKNLSVTNPYDCGNRICFVVHNFLKSDIVIELVDVNGKILFHGTNRMNNTSELISIDHSHFTSGYYFLKVNNPAETITKKVFLIK